MIVRVPRTDSTGRQLDAVEAGKRLGGKARYLTCTRTHFIFECDSKETSHGG